MLYKYPQQEFPYRQLIEENKKRTKEEAEFEIIDTGIFDDDKYFDIFIEYAKESPDNILIRITVHNRANESASLNLIPSLWFRNTWAWGYDDYKPQLSATAQNIIDVYHKNLGQYYLFTEDTNDLLFCNNETNTQRLYGYQNGTSYYKDGINNHIVNRMDTINRNLNGTKAALNYELCIAAGESATVRMSLCKDPKYSFVNFDKLFERRKKEADIFYRELLKNEKQEDIFNIKKQALAGLLWNKQFYYFNVHQWLNGDPAQPAPPPARKNVRNADWENLDTKEILSMPDKWEFPWFASWDMAFHCLPLAMVDIDFAKSQLLFLTKEWYMHPNGQLPAYEWNFSDSNPPIHAMAAWEVYRMEKAANNNKGDLRFLEKIFHKLMLNFTWWVNRKDARGNNIFQGGFLGLDNIGVFERNSPLPTGGYLEQADATSWMAMYSLNLLNISQELSLHNGAYHEISSKFFEHFLHIAGAMNGQKENLWDDGEDFYYDKLRLPDNGSVLLKIRSMVGLIPLFVVETIPDSEIKPDNAFYRRMKWFKENRPDLSDLVSHWGKTNKNGIHLISLLRGYRMKMILKKLLDENEFLSDYGIRSVSKFHQDNPYQFYVNGDAYRVKYNPGESDSNIFGGNSNWRGPVWLPMNALIIKGLRSFYLYYGDDFKIECPTGSGIYLTLNEVADELVCRVIKIFARNTEGVRPVYGDSWKQQTDKYFKDHILFYEYFHGDNGKGLGASHQTGWTALIAYFSLSRAL
jgi:glycogen debranching enzyme